MSSNESQFLGSDPGMAANRPTYESFLRIKQGVGSEALRAAGLPPAETLSYDSYIAALTRKAAATRAATEAAKAAHSPSPQQPTPEKRQSRQTIWVGLVGAPVILVLAVLVSDILRGRADAPSGSSATEAVAAPLTGDGLPVTLTISEIADFPTAAAPDETLATPLSETVAPAAAETAAIAPEGVSVMPVSPQQVSLQTAARSSVMPVEAETAIQPKPKPVSEIAAAPQKRVASAQKKQAAVTRTAPKKQQSDFWQPLVDLLDGKGVRPARNAKSPEDRPGH